MRAGVSSRLLRITAAGIAASWLGCSGVPPDRDGRSEKSRPPPIAVTATPSDRVIQDRIVGIFAQLEGLEDVHVGVHNGVVHLSGATATVPLEQDAVGLANRVEGVVHVVDDVEQTRGAWGVLTPLARMLRRFGHSALEVLPRLGAAAIVFLPFWLFAMLLRRWRKPLHVFGVSPLSGGILRAGLRVLALVVGFVLALDVIGVIGVVGAVFGTLGLLGVIAGFVFKDWVGNYLPGVALGLHPPFKAGDLIQLGPHEGRVVRITPRATVLMTADGEELRLPNTLSLREPMINFSHHERRRLRFTVPLAPFADLQLAQQLGRDTLLATRGVVAHPPPFMRTHALERDRVEVEFYAWVDQRQVNFRSAESAAKRAVLGALWEHHVPLPEDSLIIQRPSEVRAGRAHPGDTIEADPAEDLDHAFLDDQLQAARAAPDERDLLAEGAPPGSEHDR